ncbi:MAG: KilA-N domain-containing protein [Cetobacterium sp.]
MGNSNLTSEFVLHNVDTVTVGLRQEDCYINATAMESAHKAKTGISRRVTHWLENKRTQETLEHLSTVVGIPTIELIQVFQGAPETGGGTWIHPKLAVRFGMWLSDDFGFLVETWVQDWQKPIQPQPTLPRSFAEALQLAADQAKAIELQEIQIKLLEEDNERQAEAIDELFDYSSIIRIAKFNNCCETNFNWRKLVAASKALNVEAKKVPCPRYVTKNLYSHDAWRLVYPEYNLPETTTLTIAH